jgi:hypothetical protein
MEEVCFYTYLQASGQNCSNYRSVYLINYVGNLTKNFLQFLIPCSEVITKIISVFRRFILPQLLKRKWEFRGGSISAQPPVQWVMGLFPRGKAVGEWC